MFKSAFERRGLAPLMLSRTIGAAGTPTSALIPWNSCGAYMAGTLGVSTLHYLPYAVFNIASPLLTIAITATGLRLPRAASPRERAAAAHTSGGG
jgi:NhaC family Na+:H+ antiporter